MSEAWVYLWGRFHGQFDAVVHLQDRARANSYARPANREAGNLMSESELKAKIGKDLCDLGRSAAIAGVNNRGLQMQLNG